jgi:F-type H+-transporting ATPase subunit epsilon
MTMINKFELTIISAERKVFDGEVENVLVPGMIGDFLVLSNHAPCISSIRPGFLEFSEGTGQKKKIFRLWRHYRSH